MAPVVYGDQNEVFLGRDFTQSRNYSEQIATDIDEEIKDIVEKCYAECTDILNAHMDKLHQVAEKLLVIEKMDEEEFKAIMTAETAAEEVSEPIA